MTAVTAETIEQRIRDVLYIRPASLEPPTLVLCIITLDNGFHIVGKAACVDMNDFDEEVGQELAYNDAFNQIWTYLGFMLAEERSNG